jgi:hypothetical protein
MDPWDHEWTLRRAKRANIVAEREKMPFELTPGSFVSPVSSRGQRSKLPQLRLRSSADRGRSDARSAGSCR